MQALIRKAGAQLIRRRFGSIDELLRLLQESLVEYLQGRGVIQDQGPVSDLPKLRNFVVTVRQVTQV